MTRSRPAGRTRPSLRPSGPVCRVLALALALLPLAGAGTAAGSGPPPAPGDEPMARLRTLSPTTDADQVIELAPQVLEGLGSGADPAVTAQVRAAYGQALRTRERFRDAAAELRTAADLARSAGDADLQASCLADLARVSFRLGDFDRTVAACREALLLPGIGDNPDRSWTFLNIVAAVQIHRGEYAAAIETSGRALESRERAGDRHAMAIILNNIGVAHMYLGDHEQALEYLHRARLLKAELGETDGVADMLANIGDIKHLQGHDDEAIEIHREALALRENEGGDRRIAESHRSLAAALQSAGRYREALEHIDQALTISRRLGLDPEIVSGLAIRAEALAAMGRADEAVSDARASLELARKLGMRGREVVALDALIVALGAANDPSAALEHLAEAREIERELMNDEIRDRFASFQASFENREKEREIELLRKENELKALDLSHQRLWRNSLAIGIGLLLILAAVGWHRYLDKKHEVRIRREADAALLQSVERYRRLFERNLAGVFQTDFDGIILIANQTFAVMLGYEDPDEVAGRSLQSLAADPQACQSCLDQLAENSEIRNLEITLVSRTGQNLAVLMNAGRVASTIGSGEMIEGIAIDISDRARAEEDKRRLAVQLQQSQRLESLGVLAGGIAHDFNNMLMAILSNISLAKRSAAASGEALRRLDQAEEACLRATGLTQQLLTFSKGGRPIRKTSVIGNLVTEATEAAIRGSSCRLEMRIDDGLWPTDVDEGQVVQAIQNLVLNAVQAMPKGGTIHVSTENVHLAEGDLPSLEGGRYVRVEVTDSGVGIPNDHIDRIFDPFFTTRRGGSGLGLATAFSIVRSHGGGITVRSEPGRGSTFSVLIPASARQRHHEEDDSSEPGRAHGRLLVMDDDEAVRSAAAELLETIGYEVETAADGAEAIELYVAALGSKQPFDAVVLDLTVPEGIGGRETMARLLVIDPAVKAIVSSGYSTDPVMANFRDHGFSGVAVKPYRLAELARTLSIVLGDRRRPHH